MLSITCKYSKECKKISNRKLKPPHKNNNITTIEAIPLGEIS